MTMSKEFDGKVALVTGAGSGIGAAVARQLAEAGAKVVVADRNLAGAQAVVDEITKAGGTAVAYSVDVGKPEAVEATVKFVVETYGQLNLAVNNAGIGGPARKTADYGIDEWHNVVNIDLNSVFYSLKYEIPAILAAGGGAIVNMASILGTNGFATAPAYVASKHGVVGLTKTSAIEYAKDGIRINAVGPGFIRTPLLDSTSSEAFDALTALHPIGRLGTSEEVAALTVFLLSDKASFITGSYHLVDGGYSAQ
jgi:NAD(P)-dependent dehydrogenase (short-subunit alcohol dehydrogenase family)